MIVQICYAYPTKPSTSNVQQGFSLLTLLLTKQKICLKPKNLEKLEAYSHETHATWHGGEKNTFKQVNLCYNKHGLYFCTIWDCC